MKEIIKFIMFIVSSCSKYFQITHFFGYGNRVLALATWKLLSLSIAFLACSYQKKKNK